MKSFKDLIFKPHPYSKIYEQIGKQAIMNFENGYGVSVLLGDMFYSNGIDTYELAVLKNGHLCYDTPITDDVLGHKSKEQISEIMRLVQELPPLNE